MMYYRFCLTLVVGLWTCLMAQPREVGSLIIDGIPDIPQRISDRMNQYQNVRSATFADWDPNGSGMLISTRFAETSQIHFVARPGAARQQLTFFKEPVSSAAYDPRPDKHGFLFSMDTGGGEFYQLFYLDLNSGKTTLLTDGKSRNMEPLWSHDGNLIAFSSNLRNGKDTDVRLMSPKEPGTSEVLFAASGSWSPLSWSGDNNKLLVINYVSVNESYLYWYDLGAKKLNAVNPQPDQKIAYAAADWNQDATVVYYSADETGEFQQLIAYEIASAKKETISAKVPWDVTNFTLTEDRKKLAYCLNEDGRSTLRVVRLDTREELPLPKLPLGIIYNMQFTKNGEELALTLNTPQTSGDVYSIKFATQELARWTFSEAGGLKTENFVMPALIRYPTFDKVDGAPRLLPAFYYKPATSTGKIPVVISIHGGPESQELPYFNSFYQYLVNELGMAVIAPNVRGSAGYGKTYLTLDNDYKREDSVKDIGALLDWIKGQKELDADRIGVYGGSYGGYMVLSSMCYFNDKIRAGVDIVGISNLVTFLERTQDYRRDLRRVEYGDERDPKMREYLTAIAPTTNAHKITKPLFVVQGLNDPRVPASESEQIVRTIRGNGGKVWYLAAKNEGHGFRRKSNRDYYLNAMMLFWETFLLEGRD